MPKTIVLSLIGSLVLSWSLFAREAAAASEPPDGVVAGNGLEARADAVLDALIEHYWNPKLRMFSNAHPCHDCNGQFHYWWQAHGIDALLDGYERTGDPKYLDYVRTMYDGLRWRNGGHLFNDFYDDEEWMALALLRAHTLSDEADFLEAALKLWDDIRHGWNDAYGGGISWRKSQRAYKNAPANGPAAILAARLFQATGDEEHLVWAKRIYTWLREHLVDPDTSLVWDGINRTGDGSIDRNWLFTYNQGTFIGAGVALWQASQDEAYLSDAIGTAQAAIQRLSDFEGVFPDEGQGDGGLFKGILVRYLIELYRAAPNDNILAALRRNAESAWRAKTDATTFGPRWKHPKHYGRVDLSSQLSAVMLFNLLALVEGPADEEVSAPGN